MLAESYCEIALKATRAHGLRLGFPRSARPPRLLQMVSLARPPSPTIKGVCRCRRAISRGHRHTALPLSREYERSSQPRRVQTRRSAKEASVSDQPPEESLSSEFERLGRNLG